MTKKIESVILESNDDKVYLVYRTFHLGERLGENGGAFPMVEIHSIWNEEVKAQKALEVFQEIRPSAGIIALPTNIVNPFEGISSGYPFEFLPADRSNY
jgi:hypothetical protein